MPPPGPVLPYIQEVGSLLEANDKIFEMREGLYPGSVFGIFCKSGHLSHVPQHNGLTNHARGVLVVEGERKRLWARTNGYAAWKIDFTNQVSRFDSVESIVGALLRSS